MTDSSLSTLLVVEDEVLVRQLAVMALEDTGARIVEASNVDEAERIIDALDELTALVSDVQMPGRRDGLDLAGIVRNKFPDCVIVLTSGRSLPTDRPLPAGTLYISKPWSPDRLAEFVCGEIGNASATASI